MEKIKRSENIEYAVSQVSNNCKLLGTTIGELLAYKLEELSCKYEEGDPISPEMASSLVDAMKSMPGYTDERLMVMISTTKGNFEKLLVGVYSALSIIRPDLFEEVTDGRTKG